MVAYSDGRSFDDNLADIRDALEQTRTGRVMIAVRDGVFGSTPIRAGDAVGFAGGHVVTAGLDPVAIAAAVLEALGPGEALTVLTGADAPPSEADAVRRAAEATGAEVEMRDGGQPVHRYLFALE